MTTTDVDVLIIGAGLSGIGMAAQLARLCPDKRFLVVERREALGGTWDYFRYPGIRCDSDMYTLGYAFRPWTGRRMITDAQSILDYLEETAREYGVLERIRFGHRVIQSSWSSADARWTVSAELETTGEPRTFTANFLVDCAGYYSYDEAYRPEFDGEAEFDGDIVHAQFWDPDYDYSGKRVVIVGSGATAVTLAPSMADRAGHVTMLQRSPTYMLTLPEEDPTVRFLQRFLPAERVATLTRTRNTFLQLAIYRVALRYPKPVRRMLLAGVRKQLGPDVDMKHFTPSYNPWEQRLCAVPDGDLFEAVRERRVSMVTDHIDRFVPEGIRLASGETIPADLVVLATGFKLQFGGGADLVVDGEAIDRSEKPTYRGVMMADVPNYASVFGYVNTSWTRKADLVYEFVCRVLHRMDRQGAKQVTPRGAAPYISDEPIVRMKSGYLKRGMDLLPKQGKRAPWRAVQNVFYDTVMLRYAPLAHRFLEFTNPFPAASTRSQAPDETSDSRSWTSAPSQS